LYKNPILSLTVVLNAYFYSSEFYTSSSLLILLVLQSPPALTLTTYPSLTVC
jgi:hypothetical protein